MDQSEILKATRRLPIKVAMRKFNLTHDEARALRGLPPAKFGRKPIEPKRPKQVRITKTKYQSEVQSYVDKYNRIHGTDYVPLFKRMK